MYVDRFVSNLTDSRCNLIRQKIIPPFTKSKDKVRIFNLSLLVLFSRETNSPVKMNSSTSSESDYRFSHTVEVKNSFQLDSRSKGKETASYRSWAQQTEESYQLQLALALRLSAEATCADDPHFLGPAPNDPWARPGSASAEVLSHRFWVWKFILFVQVLIGSNNC